MIFEIPRALAPEETRELRFRLERCRFEPGGRTAGDLAVSVKRNEQLARDDANRPALEATVRRVLDRNPILSRAIHPKRIGPVDFNRFATGMAYGPHIDAPLMGDPAVRSDVSVTLFLSDPGSYDGGELVIAHESQPVVMKPAAGSLVVYPSSTLHQVRPVTRGIRLAAIAWIESRVRLPQHREILFDMERCLIAMGQGRTTRADLDRLAKSYANLLRLWAET